MEKVKTPTSNLNRDVMIIPGNMTSQLHVCDVAVNKPFKGGLHSLYSEWLLSVNCPLAPAGNVTTLS
jgi:hypothetical protein